MLSSDETLSTTISPQVTISLIGWNHLRTLLMRLGFPCLSNRPIVIAMLGNRLLSTWHDSQICDELLHSDSLICYLICSNILHLCGRVNSSIILGTLLAYCFFIQSVHIPRIQLVIINIGLETRVCVAFNPVTTNSIY